ncbi:MAG: hypothetical protein GY946_22160 [bacterium]|nr:hypothetical protein [bacterium]
MQKPLAVGLGLVAVLVVAFFGAQALGLIGGETQEEKGTTLLSDDMEGGAVLEGREGATDIEGKRTFEGEPVGVLDVGLGKGTLTGLVTGEGPPLGLARVQVVLPPPNENLGVRTKKDGTYESRGLPLEQHERRGGATDYISRTVTAPAFLIVTVSENVAGSGQPEPETQKVETVDLRRRKAYTNAIDVIVRDVYGQPMMGANVLATTMRWDLHMSMGPEVSGVRDSHSKSGRTDDRGHVLLSGLAPEEYNVVATASGHIPQAVPSVIVGGGRTRNVRFQLPPGSSISGKVVDATGAPVEGAFIGGMHMGSWSSSMGSTSGADGTFTLDGLRKGAYMLFAADEERGTVMANISAPGQGAKLELPGTGTLKLRVRDASGEPVSTAEVRPFSAGPFQYVYSQVHALKSEAGIIEIPMPEGNYQVRVRTDAGDVKEVGPVEVKIGKTASLEVTVPASGRVRGVVVDEEGEHVGGAEIFVRMGGFPPSKSREQYARSDAEGRFEIAGLPLERTKLKVQHAEYADTEFDATPETGASTEVTVRIARGASIAGHVRNGDGNSLGSQQVTLYQNFMEPRITFTDEDGAYAFPGVPEGSWSLKVGVFEQNASGQTKSDIKVGLSGTVTVDFEALAASGRVTGLVRLAGKPLAGATVKVIDDRGVGQSIAATTDENGYYAVDGVQPGSFQVHVDGEGGASTVKFGNFGAGETTATRDIDLGSAVIKGTVVNEDGKPLSPAWVMIEDADAEEGTWSRVKAQATTKSDGSFMATGLAAGRYKVRVQQGEYAQQILEPKPLADGATLDLGQIRMRRGTSLSGRVVDDTGAPVEDVTISLKDTDGRPVMLFSMSTTGSDGRYTLQGVQPGSYVVRFQAKGYAPDEKPVELSEAGATADGTLTRGGILRVVVRDDSGRGVAGARVSLLDAAGRPVTKTFSLANLSDGDNSKTDEQGMAQLPDLASGTYQVNATRSGYVAAGDAEKAVVAPGATTTIELTLTKQ